MTNLLFQLLPIFVYFGLGLVLKKAGLADKSHGDFLLRFVFFVCLPLLILVSVSGVDLGYDKLLLPFINIAVNAACLLVMYLLTRRLANPLEKGAALVNAGIQNNSFMFPFILAVFGQAGFANAVLLDLGNALWMASVMYLLAYYYGGDGERHDPFIMLKRIAKSPLIWSLCVSLVLSFTHVKVPARVITIINPLAQMTAPLILVALGLYFSLTLVNLRLALQIVAVRMGVGVVTGTLLALLLTSDPLTRGVIIACSAGPIGFSALAYSSLAKLDTGLSASAVSISILTGLIGIPVLLFLLTS
jgi:predicted permease